ncbi:MAG: hypothetical protein Q4F49_01295 [Pseudoxanthomonas suwonensis]|nr:hypothetical protein [Pseudoxanthomonas suwonensis]
MRYLIPTTLLALSVAIGCGRAAAQDAPINWTPRTGDVWIDEYLGDMNAYGIRHRDSFVDEMVRYYGAPRALVTELLVGQGWAPGDVYYACAIGQIIGRPCRYVVDEWNRDNAQGWGVVAQRLGIKPGSEQFHRLKRGFVPTYDRWARPIHLDDELRRHYPNRGNAGDRGNAGRRSDSNRGQGQSRNRGQGNRGQGQPQNRGQGKRGNPGRGD